MKKETDPASGPFPAASCITYLAKDMSLQRDKPLINQGISPVEGQKLLEQGAKTLGLSLSVPQLQQFWNYLILLQKWNRTINLTGLQSNQEILVKHFLDSLTPLPYLPEGARLMDLGSGAGFPGLPIKICRPHQPITLVEASSKKVSFLKEVIRHLDLQNIQVVQGYLDRQSPLKLGTAPFSLITTRAVGKLTDLLGGVSAYLPQGGKLMLMKGSQGLKEVMKQKDEIQRRGFQIDPPIHLTLPILNQERILIFLTKQ